MAGCDFRFCAILTFGNWQSDIGVRLVHMLYSSIICKAWVWDLSFKIHVPGWVSLLCDIFVWKTDFGGRHILQAYMSSFSIWFQFMNFLSTLYLWLDSHAWVLEQIVKFYCLPWVSYMSVVLKYPTWMSGISIKIE